MDIYAASLIARKQTDNGVASTQPSLVRKLCHRLASLVTTPRQPASPTAKNTARSQGPLLRHLTTVRGVNDPIHPDAATTPPVRHAVYPQHFNMSCGAASLLTAAVELGVDTLPELKSLPPVPAWGLNKASEQWIYRISSGATTGPLQAVTSKNIAAQGYSMPHNLMVAARLLGLDGTFYRGNTLTGRLVFMAYPEAANRAKGSGVGVRNGAAPPLQPHQRDLCIVITKDKQLHWVVKRPDGSFMDPGDGTDYVSKTSMRASTGYHDTGMHLRIHLAEHA